MNEIDKAVEDTNQRIKDVLLEFQMLSYLGTSCVNCGHVFTTIEEIKQTTWIGYKKNPLCCNDKCFREFIQNMYL